MDIDFYSKYINIDLIKPNLKEAEVLIGKKIISREELLSAATALKKLFYQRKLPYQHALEYPLSLYFHLYGQ